jgi:hypothetical protein
MRSRSIRPWRVTDVGVQGCASDAGHAAWCR